MWKNAGENDYVVHLSLSTRSN